MALDNMPEADTRQLHPPDVREAALHDARGAVQPSRACCSNSA